MLAQFTPLLSQIQQSCPQISSAELNQFASGLTLFQLANKSHLLQAGEIPTQMVYLCHGLIKVYYSDEQGELTNINFCQEGQFAGDYLAYMQQRPSKYSFQCLEHCTLIGLPFAHIQHSLQQSPQLERFFRLQLEQAFASYLYRTESFLISQSEKRYRQFMQQQPNLLKRLSLTDLSSYLGIKRQHLTRIRQKMRG
ncbi:Crp/Fnr family transcriptional regulator [Volucribacter amazonae]|uniref:Cyclic nucleotide-binding domain-containing protein n=1 Tax=Volucribacter amazonae TaxID=256731 RepID=A0A9X4PCD6_9PAST|nr:Crp/Fnr family transcriptional regulator [Volucribacter amazonae]MDG6895577.1 hypothetical protein [Volucribacter amazonae]